LYIAECNSYKEVGCLAKIERYTKERAASAWNTRNQTVPCDEPMIEAVARGLAITDYRLNGLETLTPFNEAQYSENNWQDYKINSQAAITAINQELRGRVNGRKD
jgi:hypothetical protein